MHFSLDKLVWDFIVSALFSCSVARQLFWLHGTNGLINNISLWHLRSKGSSGLYIALWPCGQGYIMVLPCIYQDVPLSHQCIHLILHWFWNVNEIYALWSVQYKNIALTTVRISRYSIPKSPGQKIIRFLWCNPWLHVCLYKILAWIQCWMNNSSGIYTFLPS